MKDLDFEDVLKKAKEEDVKRLLQEVDMLIIAKALKAASPDVTEKIYQNIPSGKTDKLKHVVISLGTIQMQEVEKAQKQISNFLAG